MLHIVKSCPLSSPHSVLLQIPNCWYYSRKTTQPGCLVSQGCNLTSVGPSLQDHQPCTHLQETPRFLRMFTSYSESLLPPSYPQPLCDHLIFAGTLLSFWDISCLNFPPLINTSALFFTLVMLKVGTSSSKPFHLDPETTSPHVFLVSLLCPTPLDPSPWPAPPPTLTTKLLCHKT